MAPQNGGVQYVQQGQMPNQFFPRNNDGKYLKVLGVHRTIYKLV